MGFLTNRTINCLNLVNGLFGLLEQSFGLFVPLYLYERGFSLPEIFLLLGLFNLVRIPLRFLSFPIVHRIGLKYALMLGISGFCFSFPILARIERYDIWLLLYLCVFGLFNALYWHSFHTFYSLAGEGEHRGKQIAVSQGLALAVTALGPLLSALYIAKAGYENYFYLPLVWLSLMLLVLSRCRTIPVSRSPWSHGKKLMFNIGAKIHIAEASAFFPLQISWLFALYFYLGKIISLGGVLTFGIVLQILYQLWIGSAIDRGKGHIVAHLAGGLRSVLVLARAFVPLSFPRILGLEALSSAAHVHHALAQPTAMYNTAQRSSDAFWYWLFAEIAFDIGTVIGCVGAALLLWAGVELRLVILLALPGVLAVWWLTYYYYGDRHIDI